MAGFSFSCSAFNRFAHGNRKLPCSTLSGVECHPSTPCAARQKTLNPATTLREHEKATPHRAGFATLPGKNRTAESDRKARLIGPGSGRGSAAGTPRKRERIDRLERQGRTTPRRGQNPNPRHTPARPEPNPQLKKKLSEHPATGATYRTFTRSRIARPGRPETRTEGTLLGDHAGSTMISRSPGLGIRLMGDPSSL